MCSVCAFIFSADFGDPCFVGFLAVALDGRGVPFFRCAVGFHEGQDWTIDCCEKMRTGFRRDPFLKAAHAIRLASPVYTAQCASCHGGGLPWRSGPGLEFLTWRTGQFLYGSGDGSFRARNGPIAYGIRSGRPRSWNLAYMPAFAAPNPYKPLSDRPADPLARSTTNVIDYLYSRGGAPRPNCRGRRPRRARYLSEARVDCFDCHGGGRERRFPPSGAPSLVGGSLALW